MEYIHSMQSELREDEGREWSNRTAEDQEKRGLPIREKTQLNTRSEQISIEIRTMLSQRLLWSKNNL